MLLSIWSASTFIKRRNRGTSRTAVQCIWMEFVDHGRGAANGTASYMMASCFCLGNLVPLFQC